jgi:hypothetical protein
MPPEELPQVGDWIRFYREVEGRHQLVIGVVAYLARVGGDDGWTGGEIITDIGSVSKQFVVEVRRAPK